MSREIWEERPDLGPVRTGEGADEEADPTEETGEEGAAEGETGNLAEGVGDDRVSLNTHEVQEIMHFYTRIHEVNNYVNLSLHTPQIYMMMLLKIVC